jgi:uncharacterized protein (TIGR02145 family)
MKRFLIYQILLTALTSYGAFCNTTITSPLLDCAGATFNGTLLHNQAVSTAYFVISYSGGAGAAYTAETVNSTGVTGLTARLAAGVFSSETCQLIYNVSGTPASSGTASFAISPGGASCTLSATVSATYASGLVFCGGTQTYISDVTNPSTGKIWMDRNLGASQVATSSTDASAYGDLYQWGRSADGHQCRSSSTTSTKSSSAQPNHSDFIIGHDYWLNPNDNNLWQGTSGGVNSPCPAGYRLPTDAELDAERTSWGSNDKAGAFGSPLKWTVGGYRNSYGFGNLVDVGNNGYYWTSYSTSNNWAKELQVTSASTMGNQRKAFGHSVRCIKN